MVTNFQKREEESVFLGVVRKLAFLSREVTFGLSRGMNSQQGSVPAPWSVKLAERGWAVSALRPLQLSPSD